MSLRSVFTGALLLLLACGCALGQPDAASVLRRADEDARAGRFDAARTGYATAFRMGASVEQDATRSQLVAQAYANSNPPDLLSAIRWFQNALRLSGDERVRAELADTLVRATRYDEAAGHYEVLEKSHPASNIYMIALSRALLQAGRAEDALQALQGWLTHTPGATAVRLEYARILSYQKHFIEARQQYETVLKSEPGNLVAQIGVAKVTSWQGDQETALGMYERILARNPSNYDALVGKAFALLWMGRQSEALPLLQSAARRNPNDADVREALGHAGAAAPMPPAAAAPPALPDVPAAAPFAQGEPAPRLDIPPPTTLPRVTIAERSAGTRTFSPAPYKPEASTSASRAKTVVPKTGAPKGKQRPDKAHAAQPEEEETPQPEPNVFGFSGVSNAQIVVVLSIVVGILLVLLVTMTSRDKVVTDNWHDKPRTQSGVMNIPRVVRVEDPGKRAAAQRPVAEPVTAEARAETPPPAPRTPPPANGDRPAFTLSGIPRRNETEASVVSAPASQPSPRPAMRQAPSPPRAVSPGLPTQILPRAEAPVLSHVRLNGLRVLLVGDAGAVLEVERRTLQTSGAEVMVENTWPAAVSRMTSDVVHAIVLNEGSGDQMQRIYQSVAKMYPGWLRRLLLILPDDDAPTRLFMSTCQAKCMMQPFQPIQLVVTLANMFGIKPKSIEPKGEAASAGN